MYHLVVVFLESFVGVSVQTVDNLSGRGFTNCYNDNFIFLFDGRRAYK